MPWWWPFKKRTEEEIEIAKVLEDIKDLMQKGLHDLQFKDFGKSKPNVLAFAESSKSEIDKLYRKVGRLSLGKFDPIKTNIEQLITSIKSGDIIDSERIIQLTIKEIKKQLRRL